MKKLFKEFRNFALQGDVVALAIGVVIGSVFKDLVNSLVNDIIMPPLGFVTGRVDFSNLYINLSRKHYDTLAEATAAGAPLIKYGLFVNHLVNFILISIVIFIFLHKLRQFLIKEEKKPKPETKKCPYCYSDIKKKATRCPNCTSKLEALA